MPNGGTNIQKAIVQGSEIFKDINVAEQVTRKVMIVLSDGQCGTGPEGIQQGVEYAKRQGIDAIFGIGLLTEVGHIAYDASVDVMDPRDLPKVGLRTLLKAL